jgi:predicted RNA methylase
MYELTTIETMAYHHSMLMDENRTKTFLRAILKTVKPGDVVLDLGSGTGLLAYYACMSGAKRVYAIESGPIIELAKKICRHNGFQDQVEFINDWSTHVELPEPVDVIVTETIGNVGFEEGILHWVLDARDRLLADGGRIIPRSVDLVVAPVEDDKVYGYLDSWPRDLHSLDFSPAKTLAANNLQWTDLAPSLFLSEPAALISVDITRAASADICGELEFVAQRDGLVHGIGAWFAAELIPGERLSNGPPLNTPSWSQVLLPLEKPLSVRAGQRLQLSVQTRHNAAHWQWQVSVDGAAGGQAPFLVSDGSIQETLSGELRPAEGLFDGAHMPVRTGEAEADLLILQAMDGTTTVQDIAEKVAARFPAHFSTVSVALEHIYNLTEGYCRWDNGDSQESINVSRHNESVPNVGR